MPFLCSLIAFPDFNWIRFNPNDLIIKGPGPFILSVFDPLGEDIFVVSPSLGDTLGVLCISIFIQKSERYGAEREPRFVPFRIATNEYLFTLQDLRGKIRKHAVI